MLYEEVQPTLNIKRDESAVRQAMDTLEGKGYYDYSKSQMDDYSLGGLFKNKNWRGTFIVYGSGGWHRYFIEPDGSIYFSRGHKSFNDDLAKIEAMGFGIR